MDDQEARQRYPFKGNFDRTFGLRGRTVISSGRVPDHTTTTRRQTHYSYNVGTDTTAESRQAAQTNVPTRIRNEWATGSGQSGEWEVHNPPPQRRGASWASWGAVMGGTIGAAVGNAFGEGFATTVLGPTAGRAVNQLSSWVTGAAGTVLGYGIGRVIDRFTAPTYDAGHARARAIGGIGDQPDMVFGQNPQINRGNRLNGTPTYDMHRRNEKAEATAVRQSPSSLHTTTIYF